MSRNNISTEALKQFYSPDADSTLACLLTIYDEDGTTVLARLTDNDKERVVENEDEVYYGITSRSEDFLFLPMQVTMPSEEEGSTPNFNLVMYDVTQHIVPIIRTVFKPLKTKIEYVLTKTPDIVEMSFEDFHIVNFQYNAEQTTAELSILGMEREAMPMYSCTPQWNPGLFS